MIRLDSNHRRAILSVTRVSGDNIPTGKSNDAPRNLIPGQQVRGEVLARLSDQVYLLKISGEIFRTEVSESLRPGSTILLTFRSGEPRPEFILQREKSDLSPVKLSPTTSLLSQSVREPTNQTLVRQGLPLSSLVNRQPTNTAELATALRTALTFSGIFYESHLAQWFLGERRLEDILRESRLRLTAMTKNKQGATQEKPLIFSGKSNDGATPAKGADTSSPATPESVLSDPFTANLLREQVETLLSGIFLWRGTAWPNQELEWEVEKEDGNDNSEEENSWRTTIRLQLPNLGSIQATLFLNKEGIRGRISTDSEATKNELYRETGHLERTLADSGLTLVDIKIKHENKG